MPKVTVAGTGAEGEFAATTRLVVAVEQLGVAIGHRCGGKARCTTCRVRFVSGEPETFTRAEWAKLGLGEPGAPVPEFRLSCQLLCDHDAVVEPLMTLENQSWKDTGPAVSEVVEPEAQWFRPDELAAG